MATAICDLCGKEFSWRAQRGVRLANLLSPCCKSPGHAKPRKPSTRTRSDSARIRCKVQIFAKRDFHFVEERQATISLFAKGTKWNDGDKDYYRITPFGGSFKITEETDDTCQFEDSGWVRESGYRIIVSKVDFNRLIEKLEVK